MKVFLISLGLVLFSQFGFSAGNSISVYSEKCGGTGENAVVGIYPEEVTSEFLEKEIQLRRGQVVCVDSWYLGQENLKKRTAVLFTVLSGAGIAQHQVVVQFLTVSAQ